MRLTSAYTSVVRMTPITFLVWAAESTGRVRTIAAYLNDLVDDPPVA
jgi:hypothetical protein